MKYIIKRFLLVTFAVIPLVLFLGFISFSIYFNNSHNVTRQYRDFINEMKATEHGHLILNVRMDLRGALSINILIESTEGEEMLALVNEIKPLIEERFPSSEIGLTIRFFSPDVAFSSDVAYRATGSRPWRGSPPQPSESFEWR